MVQTGIVLDISNRKWEDIPTLKKHLRAVPKGTVREYIREIAQLSTGSAVLVEEVSGETIAAIAANKALQVWQKTDQVGTDGGFTGNVEWQDVLGNVTEATYTLDATNTTTHAPLVSAVTTARFVRSMNIQADVADEILIGNVAGSEIFGVIKVGYHQLLKTGYMCPTNRDGYLGKIKMTIPAASDGTITLVITYTPKGETYSTTKTLIIGIGDLAVEWEPCYQLQPATSVTMTIVDSATAATATVETTYIEAY
jgi:hypothetical protein